MNFVRILLTAALCASFTAPVSSHANLWSKNGILMPDSQSTSTEVNWQPADYNANPQYLAVGRMISQHLYEKYFACSGAIVQLGKSKEAKAKFLTAGHCYKKIAGEYDLLANAQILVNDSVSSQHLSVYLNTFQTPKADLTLPEIKVEKIVYAQRASRDVMILELNLTYAQLEAAGIPALTLQSTPIVKNEAIVALGAPATSVFQKLTYLLESPGSVKRTVSQSQLYFNTSPTATVSPLKPTPDVAQDIEISASFINGMSGGPVLDAKTKEVFAVATSAAYVDIELFEKILPFPNIRLLLGDYNRAQSVVFLSQCFTDEGNLDLNLPSCVLASPCEYEKDMAAASACFQKNCLKGDSHSCIFGLQTLGDPVIDREHTKASTWTETEQALLVHACSNGLGWACYKIFKDEVEGQPNVTWQGLNGEGWITATCNAGVNVACTLAPLYNSKTGFIDQSFSKEALTKILPVLNENCDAKDKFSCNLLERYYTDYVINDPIIQSDTAQWTAAMVADYNASVIACAKSTFYACQVAIAVAKIGFKNEFTEDKQKQVLKTSCTFSGADPILCKEFNPGE